MTRREALAALLAAPLVGLSRLLASVQTTAGVTGLTLTEAVSRIAAGDLPVGDLTEACLARIAELNPTLNAFVTVTPERARLDAARAVAGSPLRGIPVAHKDLFETAGIRTTAGSRLFDSHVPTHDAAIVSALARAGTVLVGKTNTHELGGGVTTINPFYGTTRNPADPTRIPGGSSGGSAAAVAAGMCLAATGSDTGGSVRIPAALCGCVGFKPTFGLLDTTGLLGACPTFDHVGLLARTAADVAQLFAVLRDLGRPSALLRRTLRVGVSRSFFFDDLEPSVAEAMGRAEDVFRSRGAVVEERDLPVDEETMARVFDPIVSAEIWARYGADWRTRPEAFSSEFSAFFDQPAPPASDVDASRRALRVFQDQMSQTLSSIDVVLTPTVPMTAPPIDGPIDAARILRNTWAFNAAQTPAISVPCGRDSSGLPIGLQIVAATGHDDVVLEAALAFAEAQA